MSAIVLGGGDALLIVDPQVDFLPGGSLGVRQGDAVLAPINRLIDLYHAHALPVYVSRDWHPALHCSFAGQGGPWPVHCVAGSDGARFADALQLDDAVVVSKATRLTSMPIRRSTVPAWPTRCASAASGAWSCAGWQRITACSIRSSMGWRRGSRCCLQQRQYAP